MFLIKSQASITSSYSDHCKCYIAHLSHIKDTQNYFQTYCLNVSISICVYFFENHFQIRFRDL